MLHHTSDKIIVGFFLITLFNLPPLQMTQCQPAVIWTWRTGSPTWSRSCSFRRMKSSFWNQLWLMPCVDWATARSTPRACTQEVLGGGLWLRQLQPSRPKVTEVRDARGEAPHAAESSVFLQSWICSIVAIFQITTDTVPCYWFVNQSDNDYLTFSAPALASSSLQTCE